MKLLPFSAKLCYNIFATQHLSFCDLIEIVWQQCEGSTFSVRLLHGGRTFLMLSVKSWRDDEMSQKKQSTDSTGKIAAGITVVASVLPLVKPAIDTVREYTDKAIEERKQLVSVPELYSSEYPLTVEQAVVLLESCGLKATLVKTSLADASIQYRQCFDSQVIKSKPKSKQKVERGTSVLVKYITQEVIDESQRMYEITEKHKAELLYAKSMRHAEQKENAKRVVTEAYNTVKLSLTKIPAKFGKKEDQDEQE